MRTSKFAQTTEFRSLLVGVIFASITAYLLFVVGKDDVLSGLDQVLILISGMTTIAALSAFARFIEESQPIDSLVDDIFFDEAFVSKSIFEGRTDTSTNVVINQTYQVSAATLSPWDLSLNQLIGTDNSLALAKLRLEIERELRRIACENGIDIAIRPIGVLGLAEELISREVLPAIWLGVLKDINISLQSSYSWIRGIG